ncbi:MAG: DUF3419 family protein [Bacilli bacterium]|nr:DUF3419 family protein [Bacilli bacterium]
MEKDIEFLKKIMNIKLDKMISDENFFNWLYPFTTENIRDYYNILDFNDKEVLTVIGSGDHIINAFLKGAKHVEGFDKNPLAKYYSELKIAGVKSLSREEFILFFYKYSLFKNKKHYLNKDIYFNKIRNDLSIEYRKFWDYFFTNYTHKEIYKSYLFTTDVLNIKTLIQINDYLNENNYYKAKEILKDKSIVYHDLDLAELDKLDKNYDIIILSNIPAYLDTIYDSDKLKQFRNLIEKLNKNANTKIVVSYLYNNLINDEKLPDDIYNKMEVRKYFNEKEFDYISINSTDSFEYRNNTKDSVIITNKK